MTKPSVTLSQLSDKDFQTAILSSLSHLTESEPLRIYVDMDGVVADMVPRTLSFLGYGKLINFILDRWPEGNDHFYMSEVLGIPEIDFAFMHREDFMNLLRCCVTLWI